MTRPVCFRSGRARQAIASSRSGSKRSGGSFSSRAIAAAWARASRLSNRCPTRRLNRRACAWDIERLEQVLARLAIGGLESRRSRLIWSAGGRRSRPRWSSRSARIVVSSRPRRCWPRPARDCACTTARTARWPGPAATGSAGSPGTAAARRASSPAVANRSFGVLGQRLEHHRLQVAGDATIVLPQAAPAARARSGR